MVKLAYILLALLGMAVAFTALWAGSYFVYKYTYQDWQQFPTIMTTTFGFVGGIALAGIGLFKTLEAE